MALQVTKIINTRFRYLYRKNRYLSYHPCRFMCNELIQPHFEYVSLA